MKYRLFIILLVVGTMFADCSDPELSSGSDSDRSFSPWSPPVPGVSSSESSRSNSSLSSEGPSVSFFETADEYKKAINYLAEMEREEKATYVDLKDKKVTFARMGKEWHLAATDYCIFGALTYIGSKFYIEASLVGIFAEKQSGTFTVNADKLCRSRPPSLSDWSILEVNGLGGISPDKYFRLVQDQVGSL